MNRLKEYYNKYNLAHRVTFIYMLFGVLWILLSDKLLEIVIKDIEVMAFIQTIKGNLYVLITGVLLWTLIVMGSREINTLYEETSISEAKYRSYFEQGFTGIVLFNKNMSVVDANFKAQSIMGVSKNTLLTMDVHSMLPNHATAIVEATRADASTGKSIEASIKSQNGHITHVLISLSKILKDNNEVKNYVAFFQEINEQKKYRDALIAVNNQLEKRVGERTAALEKSNVALRRSLVEQEQLSNQLERSNQNLRESVEHLNKMQNRLVETERMSALGDLVTSLAHEVSTPVGSAMTASSYLKERTALVSEAFEEGKLTKKQFHEFVENMDESMGIIDRNLSNAVDLMKNFKQIATDQTQLVERCVQVKPLIEEILLNMKPVLRRKNISFNLDIDSNMVIDIVPGYLSQILINLLTNSYTHGFADTDKGEIKISVKQDAQTYSLVYEDNGIGVDPSILEKVFDPFFTTSIQKNQESLSGMGLGLYIVKKVVEENLEGSIILESTKGEYTRFKLNFKANTCD